MHIGILLTVADTYFFVDTMLISVLLVVVDICCLDTMLIDVMLVGRCRSLSLHWCDVFLGLADLLRYGLLASSPTHPLRCPSFGRHDAHRRIAHRRR